MQWLFEGRINLTTNFNGEVQFPIITPPFTTNLRIEFQILGSGYVLPTNLIVNVEFDVLVSLLSKDLSTWKVLK